MTIKNKTIEEINRIYDLELENVIKTVKKQKVKKILLQFPEGLKPFAQTIVNHLEEQTKKEFFIWMDSCFGACDIPIETKNLGIDLIIQFGHSPWNFKDNDIKVVKN